MPNLRYLLGEWASNRGPHKLTYGLLKALVEAVEPEDTDATIRKLRTRLERERDQTLVSVKRLREQRDSAEAELADAKVEIERLRKRKAFWEHSIESWLAEERSWCEQMAELRKERDEAKAKIERLHSEVAEGERAFSRVYRQLAEANAELKLLKESTELADAAAEIERLGAQRDLEWAAVMMGKPLGPEAEAQFEKLKADAALGGLVLGMRPDSWLVKGDGGIYYWSNTQNQPWVAWGTRDRPMTTDPAEALRAIQEEDDGKA